MSRSALTDYRQLLRLAVPILIGQVGMIFVAFADNIMVGQYSTDALASASFVNTVFNVAILGVIGFTYGLTPLVGALAARHADAEIGRTVRAGVIANSIYGAIVIAVMTALYFNLENLGQPAHLMPLIKPYYLIVLAGMVPVIAFNVFMQWSYAVGNTRMPMWIILAANALNVVGNYALIYGHWGLPELGLTGAGISTLASRVFSAVVIIAVFFGRKTNRPYAAGFAAARTGRRDIVSITRTSLPVSVQLMCETGSFSAAGIMAGWLGTIELAALQVIIVVGTLGFCIYYSFGSAVAVKVSNAAGMGDNAAMRRYAWRGYHIMLIFMLTASLTFIFAGKSLMGIFSSDTAVVSMAASLIVPLVMYQLGDATQVTFANSLRGTGHVMSMLWIAVVSYVIVGIPATYVMTFTLGMGMTGLIGSFSVSLFVAAALFLYFFLRTTRGKDAAFCVLPR